MKEKQILEKLVFLTERNTRETLLMIKNLTKELDIYDGNVKRHDKLRVIIEGLADSIHDNNECLDYLNKRLAEII